MNSTKRLKLFQRALARYGLYISAWLFACSPYGVVRFINSVLVSIAFCFTIRQRKIAEQSIGIAFGSEKSPEERKRIIKQCFDYFGRGMAELLYYMAHPQMVDKRVFFEGKHHLDEALAKGKGVVAVTAHYGNFPLMMLTCAFRGYRTSSIIRQTRDEKLTDFLYRKRLEVGLKTVYALPRRRCVTDSLKELRSNGLLFIPIDQNFGSDGGVFVDFFGRQAATATGPAVFAARTGAVILPMFIVRQEDDTHKIIIEPPIPLAARDTEQESMNETMAEVTRLIERYIRRYPHEWAWMHRRWKSRPSG